MTATSLSVTTTAALGTTFNAAAAVDQANGNTFTNTGREAIIITNLSGSTLTVTFTCNDHYKVATVNYAVTNLAVTLNNNTSKVCGPFDKTLFNDGSGNVDIAWSTGTNVTARVFSLGSS